jgi:hypothetical protein
VAAYQKLVLENERLRKALIDATLEVQLVKSLFAELTKSAL